MNVTLTGGSGFIGSNFVKSILARSDIQKIINIDNLSFGTEQNNFKYIDSKKYQFIKADILDTEAIQTFIKNSDVLVNFAAETHVDRSIRNPSPFIRSNIHGTYNLLEIERKTNQNIRHIQISTDEVYGSVIETAFKETDRLRPTNPYAATKAAGDLLCNSYHLTYGMDILVTRCTNNFGPYQFPEKLIPKTIIRALHNTSIPLYGTGRNIRDWIYVLDHCKAIQFLIVNGKPGEIYNISSGNEKTNTEIVSEVLTLLSKPSNLIKFVEDRPSHDIKYYLDSNKLRSLGWKPECNFEDALKETVEWYVANERWWKPKATTEILEDTPWKNR
jgi:dTDP-glucose 4,6-dehydratase